MNPVTNRPAETGGVAGGVAILVGHILGINDAGTLAALALVLGFLPAGITWMVTLIRGKSTTGPTD
jgi:hypothetical protein